MSGTSSAEVELDVIITARRPVADGVIQLDLAPSSGGDLPPWEPGAHIDVILANGDVRQYSLCGDPACRTQWSIGVLRETEGRGGSRFIHDTFHAGDRVAVRGPRNHFALAPASRYIFIAGGIGITPILPMIRAADAAGADWRLAYGGRTRASMAFREDLAEHGVRVSFQPFDDCGHIDLASLLDSPAPDTLIYACGPEPLLAAIEQKSVNWPAGALHVERFAAKPLDDAESAADFEVELAKSGHVFTIPADRSIMEVIEGEGMDVLYSCRMGVCGSCETRVLSGEIDHRDSVLDDMDKAGNDRMIICVSRGVAGKRIVLDL
ncbi:MAG: PDR/VanB family oxidoreductase [Novosphingobium sp.]|uniref:PDR/VanB family oxidoreductase n=1 Tax=Novosphingobium sp. TaxID=1874826 RepID=UPI0027323B3D|nr:PDR/VanB family oxidoreductase [Novosphingobium sp.]MDP3551823.1 PDR/VanB family oxidoreductase [Novosphingobium sp.]